MTIENSKSTIVNPKVLSLDPSSTVVGWAVMASATRLIEAGLITPARRADPYVTRCDEMANDLCELLDEYQPATVLIEIPSGKVHRKKKQHTHGMGLSVYGYGVGTMRSACRYRDRRPEIIEIFENDWTRGVPKRDRQLAIASMFDQYRVGDDPGGDMADAIGLAVWWFRQRNLFQTG